MKMRQSLTRKPHQLRVSIVQTFLVRSEEAATVPGWVRAEAQPIGLWVMLRHQTTRRSASVAFKHNALDGDFPHSYSKFSSQIVFKQVSKQADRNK